MDKDCKITLHYFDARGRAELARYILTYAKKEFTDHRIAKEDWPAFKQQCPLGQVPVIEFEDKDSKPIMLCQSNAIVRHLATLFDLEGKNVQERARADEAFECLVELFEHSARIRHAADATKKEELIKRMKDDLAPRIFGFLEKRVKEENGGRNLAGGDGFTYVDIFLAMMVDGARQRQQTEGEREKYEKLYPNLVTIAKAINESSDIQEYLAKRPVTEV